MKFYKFLAFTIKYDDFFNYLCEKNFILKKIKYPQYENIIKYNKYTRIIVSLLFNYYLFFINYLLLFIIYYLLILGNEYLISQNVSYNRIKNKIV